MALHHVVDLPSLPDRPADGHKGTFGRVMIVAGSLGMSGAAALSGLGALRGGAGLVYLAVPDAIVGTVAGVEPSYLTIPLPGTDFGHLAAGAVEIIRQRARGATAMAIGPGLGRSTELTHIVRTIYEEIPCPLVVDADALNALSELKDQFPTPGGPRIMTPHPGEFSRLSGIDIATIQQSRQEVAAAFAAKHKVVLVLKGPGTVVTDGSRSYVNTTGNSGMATGGTGDVLTGLLAALLAQGMQPFDAAQFGVYLHGLAGDIAATELSEPGLIASDVARMLPRAWKSQLESATD